MRVSVFGFEAGRAFPMDKNGSHLYVIAGLASLNHKAGFAVFFSRNLGLDLGVGFDVMQTRVTYSDLNNYSETKNAGVLMTAGMGLSYRL